jgi:hypothetical protein
MAVETAKKPAPAAKRPNWRRDRGEKNIDCDSGDVAASGAGVEEGLDMIGLCRKAIGRRRQTISKSPSETLL